MTNEYYNRVLAGLLMCKRLQKTPPERIDEQFVEMFCAVIHKQVPDGLVEEAFTRHIANSTFFPSPHDIISASQVDLGVKVALAWSAIKRSMQAPNSAYLTWCPDDTANDETALAAVKDIGVKEISMWLMHDEAAIRKRFETAYNTAHATGAKAAFIEGPVKVTPTVSLECLSIETAQLGHDDEGTAEAKEKLAKRLSALEDKMSM